MSDSVVSKDTIAGLCGATGKIIAGHPFETIKIRMQCHAKITHRNVSSIHNIVNLQTRFLSSNNAIQLNFNSLVNSIQSTFKSEGIPGFYRGVVPTVNTLFLYNSTLFASFGYALDRIASSNSDQTYKISHIALAGMFSGAICSILTAPLELIRTKLQAQTFQEKLYSGPLDCAKKIYSHSGIKGLYRGVGLTFCREIPANAFYFSAFESILGNYGFNMSKSEDGQKRYHGAPPILVFLAGGLAGIANWAFIYPIDMLKSKYQADHLVHPRFSGMKDLFKHAALEARKTSGKSLFSGYSACLLRAFVANAATFSCVELCRKYLE